MLRRVKFAFQSLSVWRYLMVHGKTRVIEIVMRDERAGGTMHAYPAHNDKQKGFHYEHVPDPAAWRSQCCRACDA